MRRAGLLRASAFAGLAALACTNGGENRITGLTATGVVDGFVRVDANGSRVLDPGDDSLPGLRVRLVLKNVPDTGLLETAQPNGFFRFKDVPVGVYRLRLDSAQLSDTLQVVRVDSTSFTVRPLDTLHINALAGLPLVSVRQARALPRGRRVFVQGVAMNGSFSYADSTVHLADTSGSIRLIRVRTAFAAGDSLRVRATAEVRQGQPTLEDPTVFALGLGLAPAPAVVTTAAAATGGGVGGARDAQLVRARGAVVLDTASTATSFLLTVSDGSGNLVVELDRTADPAFQPANLPGGFIPGNTFDLLGLLSATGSGTWRLKPRSAADLTLIPPPVLSVAAARALPAGRIVVVVGTALNNSVTFSDTTVHLADNTGAIRLSRLRTAIAAGDSVRVRATTASRNGQPTLDDVTSAALGRGLAPTAATLTTAAAGTASGGTRDAGLVVVRGATISSAATATGGFALTVNDGSGALEVLLDPLADPAFQPANLPGVFIPGSKFDVLGVLVPTGAGGWRLKPRSAVDLTEIAPPVLSIAAARALPAGSIAVVVGTALNGSTTFSDTTVYLADNTGAIRLTRLRTAIASGDSVKVRATTASRAGQPTLDDVTSVRVGAGLFPTAAPLTTAAAATAASGTRDAALAIVLNVQITDTTRVAGNLKLTVNDGSGALEVLLDRLADPAFQTAQLPGVFVPGNRFDVVGVLEPLGTGVWRLKPRSAADLKRL